MSDEERATKQNILNAAKVEFLGKGFAAASLRNIVKEAGVTTGAFYGYYASKEALFRALVEEPAGVLLDRYRETQDAFAALPPAEQLKQMGVVSGACMDWMVGYIYGHFDAFKLIVCGSQGTEYEAYLDAMVGIEVESTHRFLSALKSLGHDIREIDGQLEHILISGMFSAFFEMVVHDMPEKQAVGYIQDLEKFYLAGWRQIMGL